MHSKIQKILGENCTAIYTAYPKFFHSTTVIVIQEYPFSAVQKIKDELKNMRFILLTEKEITDSSDVFPLHFLAIQRTRTSEFGDDIFKNISLEKKDMRRKIEYDLRNKNIYLRQEVLHTKPKSLLPNILPELFPAFLSLAYLLDVNWSDTEYTQESFYSLLTSIDQFLKKKQQSHFHVFSTLLSANRADWTGEQELDTLKKISISLEKTADFVNEL